MKLLFAEDEYYTRMGILTSTKWEELGVNRVMTAEDGAQAWELLSERPDILLTDIRMPFRSGIELAQEARRRDEDCEIIILSSYSDKEYLRAAISFSAVAYLEKPVRMEQLQDAILQAAERRRKKARLRELDLRDRQGREKEAEPSLSGMARTITDYIHAHYQEPGLSLETLSGLVHLTPDYLSACFKEETGKNLKRYITDVRMAEAKRLLRKRQFSVAEIAERTGYSSNHYFAKTFRRETGMTPTEYRESGEE